ncbi:hypothetical protein K525DRAFT_220151 [Schizophyllum commune Loenen D]|nr:hypothetical protein K525DRAFT_220151 [Schizophyllum commune Loenen D]
MVPQTSPSMRAAQLGTPHQQQEQSLLNELQRYPPDAIYQVKSEIGFGIREVTSLTLEEKNRLLQTLRQRFARNRPLGANNMPPPPQPGQPSRGNKRASSSPGDEDRNDGSPPNAKRQKPSPPDSGPMAGGSAYPRPPQQQQHPPMPGGPMRMGPPAPGVPPPGPMYGGPGMMHMGPGHAQPGMQPPIAPMTPQQYHNSMHAAHQGRMPQPPVPMAPPPAPGDYNLGSGPGGAYRGVPTKMPPPPSPATAAKDLQQQKKEAKSAETSPGTAPATPAPAPPASAPPTMELGARPPSQGGAQQSQAPSSQSQQQPQQAPAQQQQPPAPSTQVNGVDNSGSMSLGLGESTDFMNLFGGDSYAAGALDMDMSGDMLGSRLDYESFGAWFDDSRPVEGVDAK